MTMPDKAYGELIERLERLVPIPSTPSRSAFGKLVNPDGPEAVAALRQLNEEVRVRDRIIARLVNWITEEAGAELPFTEGDEADEALAELITARENLKETSHG